jgi:hypothetical protein
LKAADGEHVEVRERGVGRGALLDLLGAVGGLVGGEPAGGAALGVVAVEQRVAGLVVEDRGELPGQVVRIRDPGVGAVGREVGMTCAASPARDPVTYLAFGDSNQARAGPGYLGPYRLGCSGN